MLHLTRFVETDVNPVIEEDLRYDEEGFTQDHNKNMNLS